MFYLYCGEEKISLTINEGETIQDSLMRDFGWLLKPIMEQTKTFENALDKLNWKIIETQE